MMNCHLEFHSKFLGKDQIGLGMRFLISIHCGAQKDTPGRQK